jgi:6-phosphogluconolactonase
MAKNIRGFLAFLGLACVSLGLMNCGTTSSRSTGLLYVLSQGSNNVGAYALNLTTGGLTLINSKATTGKAPSSIVLDPTGSAAFVLNSGDNNITSFTVNKDGTLSNAGNPVSVPVANAVAMTRDAAGKFLFVVSQGSNPAPPVGTCPDFTANSPCPALTVFSIQSGALTQVATPCIQPGTSQAVPCYLRRVPTGVSVITFGSSQTALYIANDQDLGTSPPPLDDNTVSEYAVDSSGNVTEKVGSPYATDRVPSAVLAVSPVPNGQGTAGVFVYVTNSAGNSINVYQVCTVVNGGTCATQSDVDNLKMNAVGSLVSVGAEPVALTADPTSNFLFVVSRTASVVSGFRINPGTGVLSTLNPATQSTGLEPVAVTMHSSGKFLFVSNNGGSTVSSYDVDTVSGAMSKPGNTTSSAQPTGLVAK